MQATGLVGEMSSIQIRPATLADAARLSQLGALTFRETFEDSTTAEDMDRYLAESFSTAIQEAEIADEASLVLLAEQLDGLRQAELVGFAHLQNGDVPESVRGPAPIELKRLYVSRLWHGRGVAHALMDASLDAARARGARTIWLGVWEFNARANAFYAKFGFSRVGEHTFLLGTDAQTDWLLARPV